MDKGTAFINSQACLHYALSYFPRAIITFCSNDVTYHLTVQDSGYEYETSVIVHQLGDVVLAGVHTVVLDDVPGGYGYVDYTWNYDQD